MTTLGFDGRLVMYGILAIAVLLALLSLLRHNRMADSPISLPDLLLGEDGRISKGAVVMLGAFGLTSWVIAYQTMTDKLSDVIFGLYIAAWITPTVARLITGTPPPNPPKE